MSTGPKSRWGGKRQGAGRPRKKLDANQVQAMRDAEEKYAQKYGKTLDDLLCEIIFEDEIDGQPVTIRNKMAAIKLFKGYTMRCPDERDLVAAPEEPPIWLPPQDPDPAKLIDEKKKH